MEIIDKLKALAERLEKIKTDDNLNINDLKKQIDKIEIEELPQLEDEIGEYQERIYDCGDPNEQEEKNFDQIDDLLDQIYESIYSTRQRFELNYQTEDEDLFYDDVIDCNDEEESETDEYLIVLNEIAKSALNTIGIDNIDSRTVNLMGTILIGISSGDNDDIIAGKAFAELVMSGFALDIQSIKEMCKSTREKCQKQLFGLQIAISSLREYNCSAWDALSQISIFL